jgi:hypothetical protein
VNDCSVPPRDGGVYAAKAPIDAEQNLVEVAGAATNASAIMPRFMEPSTLLISWLYAKWRERSPFALWLGGARRKASSSRR